MHVELEQPERSDNSRRYTRSPGQESGSDLDSTDRHNSPDGLHHPYTPPLQNEDDSLFSHHRYNREVSRSPTHFTYHNYPAPDDVLYPPFSQSQPYRPTTSRVEPYKSEPYQEYLAPIPTTLPSLMLYNSPVKQEGLADDDTMSPFSMSYAVMAGGIDIHQNSYRHESPHVKSSPNPSTLSSRKLTR